MWGEDHTLQDTLQQAPPPPPEGRFWPLMWLRRDKWVGFYEGTYAPHLGDGACPADAAAKLPWRNGQPASQLLEFLQAAWVKSLKTIVDEFPRLVLQGIYHYCVFVSPLD